MSRAWAKGSTSSWRRLRRFILDRDGWRCQVPRDATGNGVVLIGQPCGAWANHVDHILPRSKGGSELPSNLRAACRSCNLRRGAKLDGQPVPAQRQPRPERWRW